MGKENKNSQMLFEMMQKVNPDFKKANLNESMLSSAWHAEIFSIADFIENNKMELALEYQRNPDKNVFEIIENEYRKNR